MSAAALSQTTNDLQRLIDEMDGRVPRKKGTPKTDKDLTYQGSNIRGLLPPKIARLNELVDGASVKAINSKGGEIFDKMDSIQRDAGQFGIVLPATWISLKHTAEAQQFEKQDKTDLVAAIAELSSSVAGVQKQAAAANDASRASMGLPPRKKRKKTRVRHFVIQARKGI